MARSHSRRWTWLDALIGLSAFGLLGFGLNRASHTTEYSSAGVLLYVVVPAAVAAAFLLLLRVATIAQAKALLGVAATTCAVLLGSLYLEVQTVRIDRERRTNPSALRARAFARLGLPFDAREPKEVVDDLKRKGVAAVPFLSPSSFRDVKDVTPLPLGGIGSALTVYCNEAGTYITFQADEHGFRNPPASHASPADIVILGDSFGMGYCVDEPGTIAGTLRAAGKRTVNLSASGNGPLYELAALREFGTRLTPRVVVWLYFDGNDMANLENESRNELLTRYLEPAFRQDLVDRQAEVNARIADFVRDPPARPDPPLAGEILAGFVRFKSLRALLSPWLTAPRPSPMIGKLERVLTAARDEVAGWQGKLVFVYLPELQAVRNPAGSHSTFRREEIAEVVRRLGIPSVDMAERFARSAVPPQDPRLPPDSHYDANGYGLTGRAILEQIR